METGNWPFGDFDYPFEIVDWTSNVPPKPEYTFTTAADITSTESPKPLTQHTIAVSPHPEDQTSYIVARQNEMLKEIQSVKDYVSLLWKYVDHQSGREPMAFDPILHSIPDLLEPCDSVEQIPLNQDYPTIERGALPQEENVTLIISAIETRLDVVEETIHSTGARLATHEERICELEEHRKKSETDMRQMLKICNFMLAERRADLPRMKREWSA